MFFFLVRKYYDFKGKRIEVKKALSRAEMNHNKQANMNQMSGPMGPMGPGPHMGPMGPMGPGPHMGPPGPHGKLQLPLFHVLAFIHLL